MLLNIPQLSQLYFYLQPSGLYRKIWVPKKQRKYGTENIRYFVSGLSFSTTKSFTDLFGRLLSVFVNSVYSFWWDVTNDWGLNMLRLDSRSESFVDVQGTEREKHTHKHSGLRPQLLFGDPSIYYFSILLNFVLRFTWSLKLSPHLHNVADIEAGIFMMEALELLRRWVWVFFRVEWETLRIRAESLHDEQELLHLSDNVSTAASDA